MKERHVRRLLIFLLALVLVGILWGNAIVHYEQLVNEETSSLFPSSLLVHPQPQSHQQIVKKSNGTLPIIAIDNDNIKKPIFILHVGPPKTGTTSLQCGMEEWSLELATNDSFYFLGKQCPPVQERRTMPNGEQSIEGHFLMMGLIGLNPHTRGVEQLVERMAYHKERGNNVIFSIEAMSNHLDDKPEVWELFQSILEGWHVRVVVAYRHYFDWIKSMYYQQHLGKSYKKKWPSEPGGKDLPSFHAYLDYHLQRFEANDPSNNGFSWGQHLSLYALEYFGRHFDDVRIFNLHQEGDVLANFVCQIIPSATHTCHQLQEKLKPIHNATEPQATTTKRVSQSFDAELLGQAAFKADLVDKSIQRHHLTEMISQRFSGAAPVTECLSPSLEARFLDASLQFEQRIFEAQKTILKDPHPNTHPTTRLQHTDLFRTAVKKTKFCEVDSDTVLQNEDWIKFFEQAKPKK